MSASSIQRLTETGLVPRSVRRRKQVRMSTQRSPRVAANRRFFVTVPARGKAAHPSHQATDSGFPRAHARNADLHADGWRISAPLKPITLCASPHPPSSGRPTAASPSRLASTR